MLVTVKHLTLGEVHNLKIHAPKFFTSEFDVYIVFISNMKKNLFFLPTLKNTWEKNMN